MIINVFPNDAGNEAKMPSLKPITCLNHISIVKGLTDQPHISRKIRFQKKYNQKVRFFYISGFKRVKKLERV